MPRKIALLAVILPFLTSCGGYPAGAQALTPQQTSLIDDTCSRIMGLRRGEYYYDACQDSLSHALANRLQGEMSARNYAECRKRGLAEGGAGFSGCMLDLQNPPQAAGSRIASNAATPELLYPPNDPDAGRSYYNVSPREHWKREQYSCAQLGFLPDSAGFTHCVANLDANLLPDPN